MRPAFALIDSRMKVYLATNTKNGKRYVGLTTGPIATRWYMHCWLAASDADYALHRAIRKHGADAFTVEEIDARAASRNCGIRSGITSPASERTPARGEATI